MTWVFVIISNSYDIKRGEWNRNSNSLLSVQEFWFAVFMTILYVHTELLIPPIANPP